MSNNQHILLAEDDSDDVFLVQRTFRKVGKIDLLKVVPDGEQAIQYLHGSGAYADRERFPLPFLLLLDLNMPRVNGFEVLQWVRAQSSLKHLLVVVLTSSNLQSDLDRAYQLGTNSYLVKPVGLTDMIHLLERFEAYWTELSRVPASIATQKIIPTGPAPG